MANIFSAFTEEQAAHITGVSVHQLRYWDREGFFRPALGAADGRHPFSRIYSFRDLLSLQVLDALRNREECSLQHLRQVKEKLSRLGDDLWLRTTLYVLNKKVVFHDEGAGEFREPVSGQIVLPTIPLRAVRRKTEQAVEELRKRKPEDIGRVTRKRNVNRNAYVLAGTRIPVKAIKRLAEDGYEPEAIVEQYPRLTLADVRAALAFDTSKKVA